MPKNMTIDDVDIKSAFKERYEKLTDWDKFIDISLQYLRRSIRVNTIKANIAEVKKALEVQGWELTQVPWCILHQKDMPP